MAENGPNQLFNSITFTILESDKLEHDTAQRLRVNLEAGGATYLDLLPNGRIEDVTIFSHIISTHVDFPEYNSALDANCHIVKPSWVEHSLQKNRLAQARQHSPDPALIFQDVVVSCGELPRGDKDAIVAGVMAMGGMYSSPLTKLVTHVVSLSEENDKVRVVREKKLKCDVVLPHWFDDCLKLGKKICEVPYLLPNPEIIQSNDNEIGPPRQTREPDLDGGISAVVSQPPKMTPPPSSPFDQAATPRKRLNAFSGRKILFGRDLNVHERLARTLKDLVERGGGTMCRTIEECDIYIGHYRDGADYVAATDTGKEVANLAWFYNVVTRNRWTNPLSKLLHYPVPRNGIPGFEGLRISVSNYTGDARLYLENLVAEAGATFTKTMKTDNTHLITAHKHSEKCDAAQEWNINIINHLWIEESYAKCQLQSLTNPRYTHFPPRTNLGDIVGQTPIDLDKVKELFIPKDEDEDDDGDDEDGDDEDPLPTVTAVEPKPSPRKTLPAGSQLQNGTNHAPIAERSSPLPVPRTVKKADRLSSETGARTPGLENRISEKENEAPPSTGRASKQKAAEQLAIARADILLFEQEMKRKGGVTHGKARKRQSDEAGMDDDESEENGDQEKPVGTHKQTKKVKTTNLASIESVPVEYRMMVSGDERWLGNQKKENEDKKTLRALGIQLTINPADCTLLCAPRILRTRKFIAALACAPEVVSTEYLDHALRRGALQDTGRCPLIDRDNEKKYSLKLSRTLERARENNRKLLRGWTIYVTDKVNGGIETYKEIIEINGGTAIPYRGRTGVQLPRRRLRLDEDPDAGIESQNQGGDEETDFVYLVSGTSEEESKVWATFRKMADKQGLEARVVGTEWLLNLAMDQRVTWDEKWELDEDLVGSAAR